MKSQAQPKSFAFAALPLLLLLLLLPLCRCRCLSFAVCSQCRDRGQKRSLRLDVRRVQKEIRTRERNSVNEIIRNRCRRGSCRRRTLPTLVYLACGVTKKCLLFLTVVCLFRECIISPMCCTTHVTRLPFRDLLPCFILLIGYGCLLVYDAHV